MNKHKIVLVSTRIQHLTSKICVVYFLLLTSYFFTFSASHILLAAPPINWEYLKDKPPDFKPCGTYSAESVEKAQSRGAIRKAGVPGVISPTTYYILVIRVDFLYGPTMTKSKADTETFFEGMKRYFLENSYGLITTSVTLTDGGSGGQGAYRLDSVSKYNTETEAALSNLINDSKAKADPNYNFSEFNHIMIYHAGRGEEESGNPADLWSLYSNIQFSVDGRTFNGFTIVPELSLPGNTPLGVVCHEYGHQLGLPDLYKTDVPGGQSTCGAWSLMDYPYGFDGKGNPPPLDMWCKDYLRWIDLNTKKITTRSDVVLYDISKSPQSNTIFYKIPVEVGTANEYFILEYRKKSNLTYNNFAGDGIAIWHIDDTIARDPVRLSNNSINNGPYPSVDLVEADNTAYYPLSQPGQSEDLFTESSVFASPLSNAFNGNPSGVAVGGFKLYSTSSTFSIDKIKAAQTLAISKSVNYPNPAGKSYSHPRSDILTTINFQLTRPPKSLNLSIYNLSGERILSIPEGKISLRMGSDIGGSSDEKWVYEYDWNGRDENNNPVAPGIYLYRIRADNQVKVGKMVIER